MSAPKLHHDQNSKGEAQVLPVLLHALDRAGWSVSRSKPGSQAPLRARKGGRYLRIVYRQAPQPRRQLLQALLADAILRGRSEAKSGEGFLVVVGAPLISAGMAASIEAYAREVAPDQPFGYVDARGLVRLFGHGLEPANQGPSGGANLRPAGGQPRDIFSDGNQWLLKVLVGRSLQDSLISVPRGSARSAAAVAAQAGVSAPAAWRLFSALKAAGHLDDEGKVVRARDLFARWRAASQRPQRQVGAAWIMPGRDPLQKLRVALARSDQEDGVPSACLGLFAACDALGVGHVRGAPIHLYVRRAGADVLEALGLVLLPQGEPADVIVRVARWPESVFRGAVRRDGAPVADIIQCWLDVSAEPARGPEQAAHLWRRVLGPALASGEAEP